MLCRSLPNDERMKERSVIHDFVENIGENKILSNISARGWRL